VIFTRIGAGGGESDGDGGNAVDVSEVDRPPRLSGGVVRARQCTRVAVNSLPWPS